MSSVTRNIVILIRVFVLILLALVMITPVQVDAQSSSSVAATITLTAPIFSDGIDVDLQWSVSGLPASATHYVLIWTRKQSATPTLRGLKPSRQLNRCSVYGLFSMNIPASTCPRADASGIKRVCTKDEC